MAKQSASGAMLAASRKASGYTQSEMAQRVGVQQGTVSRWEAEPCNMSLQYLQKWYEASDENGRLLMRKMLDVFLCA